MDAVLSALVSIAFHGLAYAMVLYLISVGLSVTMGLMGFINLAHGVFAMAGGYVAVSLMNRAGLPLFAALAIACAVVAAWKRDYGANSHTNFMAASAWDGMAAIFAAIKAQNGKVDPDKTMQILAGWKNPDSPRGPVEIDAQTRDIIQNIYIRKVERQGDHLANVEFETIPQVKDPWKVLNPQ